MAKSFTIQIFVPDGDPESIKVIDKFGWTGKSISFPRQKWSVVKSLPEVSSIGVYILSGYGGELSENNSELIDDDLPTIYIGQADPLQNRIDQHYRNKDFWDRCITFSSTDNSLNRAYVNWIEYALIEKAKASGRCHLNNKDAPKQPTLSQADKANMENFLEEILQILPLVNIRVFETINPVATPNTTLKNEQSLKGKTNRDTIVVPAQKEGFNRVFINENCWYAIRISGGMLEKIKYIAGYQTAPISAITHYAPVERIEPYGDNNKYKVIFSQPAKALDKPIPYGNASSGSMQGSRYTSFSKLMTVDTLSDLFPIR
jgi:hypothetical protein